MRINRLQPAVTANVDSPPNQESARTRFFGALALAGLIMLGINSAMAVTATADTRRDATVVAVEEVMPSVVNIATSRLVESNDPYDTMFRRFYGLDSAPQREEKINSIGSGVVIEALGEEGYILTNLHVVRRATRIQVQLWDGRVYEAQRLLWTSHKDLAVLRIVRQPGDKPFKTVRFAKDDDLLLGETVIAAGNPYGLGGSVSRGILSSKNRRAMPGANMPLGYEDWLQTDADINPGNSGGPLVNLRGELIGINVAVYGQNEGMGLGFAIPVKQVSAALSDFFTLEFTADLWLGARFKGKPYPLTVSEVQPNSPADRAGLRVGQIVVEVNDRPVGGLVEFNKLMAASSNNRPTLVVMENGTRRTLRAELLPMTELNRQLLIERLGLTTQALTETQAAGLQIKAADGLLVTEVEKDSPAARAQLQAGMVLTAVDAAGVGELVGVATLLGNKKVGERVQLTVIVPRRLSGGYIPLQQYAVTVPVR
jgi:S1-C subfamily serine protease